MTAVFIGGLILLGLGLLWYLIVAFQTSWKWGVMFILFPPITPVVFLFKHFSKAKPPVGVCLAGALLVSSPMIYTRLVPVDLGEHEQIVEGELHLTLTGWDREDYSVIERKANATVLQMANKDVTDETMEYVSALTHLKELDISFSQVGDKGITVVGQLPELTRLHAMETQITDAGFKAAFMDHPTLIELNLTGTKVSSDLVMEWMDAVPGRRALF